ncbi:DUF1553 domain-containing protein [Planctomicrobium sp. SH664]|uniref:PSD1 and planctomycete cytochrome C domain-containing protein n=1 Tax=Planctomicrobium sp. SH664 TaxID=3448125 RepID=UPI003F5BF977
MRSLRQLLGVVICLAGAQCGAVRAEEGKVDYLSQVKPLLKKHCYACHGALKQEGGLRLDTASQLLAGSDSGEVILPGAEAAESLLLERIATTDVAMRMPPEHEGEPLDAAQIELIKKWIAEGAHAPADEVPEADPSSHWSFRPIERSSLPEVKNSNWVRNPIDAWIAAGYEQKGLVPQPEASRIVLLRRLSMDLIGLPPTAEEIAAFETDPSPDWYEKAVDRLLNDPRHGERWGRHWMDIWRYADSSGLGSQIRVSHRHVWHWRDWMIESLNKDTPYDQMVRMMLAADELAPDDPDQLRATGFLARNFYIFNRTIWLDDVVTHVGKGFLGLTLNCAKCHDHKFDPIAQEDFYKMRAFFEPYQVRVDMVPNQPDLTRNGIPRAFDGLPDAPTYLFVRGDDSNPDKSRVIPPGVPKLLEFDEFAVEPVKLPDVAWQEGLRPWVLENHQALAKQRLKAATAARDLAQKTLHEEQAQQLAKLSGQSGEPSFQPIQDTFDTLDRSRWEVSGNGWKERAGALRQTKEGAVGSSLTLQGQVPLNFDATLKFRVLAGNARRNIGFVFDIPSAADTKSVPETRQMISISGTAGECKIQGTYLKDGKWNSPEDGKQPFSLDVDKDYTLRVCLRGNLANVTINGERVLSWRTPLARREGAFRIMTFDAVADFDEFELKALDPSVNLLESDGSLPQGPEEALELAEADVLVATVDQKRIELVAAAVLAQQDSNADPESQAKSRVAAIVAERQLMAEKARRDLLAAEFAMKRAQDENRKALEENLAKAQVAVEQATKELNAEVLPTDKFSLLKGSEWVTTRFQHTRYDDPDVPILGTSTGRRTALANWITDRRNPLTARVAVNHLWNRHFGTPLAIVPFDLGRNSPNPVHDQLIDWLAVEFMDNGWSLKHLHRLLVTSATYRLSSSMEGAERNVELDPDNHYWWRRNPIRIEAEVVRDSILAEAGKLDFKMGGPPVQAGQQKTSNRRSIYFFHSNGQRNLFLTTFDEADAGECYRRDESIIPQQALALMNSEMVLDASQQISDRLSGQTSNDADFLELAFITLLGMHPTEEELRVCLEAMERWKSIEGGSAEQARSNLVWALMNHNDFVTLR